MLKLLPSILNKVPYNKLNTSFSFTTTAQLINKMSTKSLHKLAIAQLCSTDNVPQNLQICKDLISQAKEKEASVNLSSTLSIQKLTYL
jgi:hypothetical protein